MEICTRVHQARSAVVQLLVIGNLFRSTWESGDLGCSDARQGLVVGARLNADSLDDRWAHAMALAALAPRHRNFEKEQINRLVDDGERLLPLAPA